MPLANTTSQVQLTQAPPSKYAIEGFVRGEPGSFQRVAGLTLLRSAIIAPGLFAVGVVFREPGLRGAKLVGASLAASTTVTLGMLGYTFLKLKVFNRDAGPGAPAPNVIDTTAEVL